MIVGLMSIRRRFMRLLRTLFYIVKPATNLKKKYGEGSWAVVTGASDGIGRGFCEELAKDGFNVCLVSRTKDKLDQVATYLHELNPSISTKVVAVDFTKLTTQKHYDGLLEQLKGMDISMLVNNVGMNNVVNFDMLN
jgi:17beta-estradiol 17-dehydrogenase / very-long-chain 3-oxoacyl-CoA reductase